MFQIVRIFFQLICLTLNCIFLHTTAQASRFIIVPKFELYVQRSRLSFHFLELVREFGIWFLLNYETKVNLFQTNCTYHSWKCWETEEVYVNRAHQLIFLSFLYFQIQIKLIYFIFVIIDVLILKQFLILKRFFQCRRCCCCLLLLS